MYSFNFDKKKKPKEESNWSLYGALFLTSETGFWLDGLNSGVLCSDFCADDSVVGRIVCDSVEFDSDLLATGSLATGTGSFVFSSSWLFVDAESLLDG